MATITKTFTETTADPSSAKSTWTLTLTKDDVTVQTSTVGQEIGYPALKARYSAISGKNCGHVSLGMDVYVGEAHLSHLAYSQEGFVKFNANTDITISPRIIYQYSKTVFNSSNPNDRKVPVSYKINMISLESGKYMSADSREAPYGDYTSTQETNLGTICYIVLDAPPTFTVSDWQKDTSGYVAGVTTVSVTISNATAQYGGNITSAKLTIGTQEATISGNGTISMTLQNAGTFTPAVTVTDSRGQIKTENLAQITVLSYEKPSVDFDIFRTDEDGIKSDEGSYGVITANLTYMGEVANLTEPTISINNTSLTNYYAKTLDTVVDNNKTYYTYSGGSYTAVANPTDADINLYYEKANIAWYSDYNSQTGVSTPIINWSQVGSNNTATIYGLVDACFLMLESYQITFVETDSQNKSSEAITQILSTAFYTIDFQAGGREIAFGAPANDDLTDVNGTDYSRNGLLKCAMGTAFNDMEQTEINQFISDLDISGTPIELTQADWVVEQGTDGIWTWRKWQSGIAECWGDTGEITLTNYTTAGTFLYGYQTSVQFPTNLFVSKPIVTYSAYVGSGFALTGTETLNISASSVTLYALCTGSGSKPTIWQVSAKGRWK